MAGGVCSGAGAGVAVAVGKELGAAVAAGAAGVAGAAVTAPVSGGSSGGRVQFALMLTSASRLRSSSARENGTNVMRVSL